MEQRFINRELTWLAFNDRVLQLASEPGIPLLERAKFCAITTTNLDEFFQVRVAALKDQVAAGIEEPTADGMTATQQLAAITERTAALVAHQDDVYLDELVPALSDAGLGIVELVRPRRGADQKRLAEVYEQRIFPVLTPLAVDPSHPFPYISNLALSIAAMVADPGRRGPPLRPRQGADGVPAPASRSTRPASCPSKTSSSPSSTRLFAGMVIEEAAAFRVTRNADLIVEEEEADDLLEAVEMELRRRRFNRAVRLEVSEAMSDELLELLTRELDLHPHDVYRIPRTDRPRVPVAAARPRTSRPQGPALAPDHGRAHRRRRGVRPSAVRRDARPGDHGPPPVRELHDAAPKPSSARPPTTHACRRSR